LKNVFGDFDYFGEVIGISLKRLGCAGILLELLLSTPEGAGIFFQFQLALYL